MTPVDLPKVVAGGDRRKSLAALRDVLAGVVADADTAYVAALTRQLREVLAELDGLAVPKESALDDLAKRRSARRGTAEVPESAVVGGVRGSGGGGTGGKRRAPSGQVAGGRPRGGVRGKK